MNIHIYSYNFTAFKLNGSVFIHDFIPVSVAYVGLVQEKFDLVS